MLDRILFWSAVLFCASFYFRWTVTGLELAGQYDAALANRAALHAILWPSLVMLLRAAWGLFRRGQPPGRAARQRLSGTRVSSRTGRQSVGDR